MSDALEIKNQIEELGKTLKIERDTNDALLEKQNKLEGGQAELKEKLDKVSSAADDILEIKENLEKTMAAVKRNGGSFEDELDNNDVDVKSFNEGIKIWLKGGMPESIDRLELNDVQRKALQSNIDPQGGYTINPFIGSLEKRLFDTSPIRQMASVQTIGTNRYVGYYDDDEFDTGWIGEIESRSDTDTADVGQFSIDIRGLYSRFKVSEDSLEDSGWNLESWASESVAMKMAREEASKFINGDNIKQPFGLLTGTVKTSSPKVYTRGQVGTITTAGATAITSDELITLQDTLKTGYMASFVMNRGTRSYIRTLKDGQGNYLWQTFYQQGVPDELLGQPVAIYEDMPDIASGAIAVAYGDIRSTYQIIDRTGMSILKDPYTADTTGQVVFRFKRRVGGSIKNWDSIKYLKQA